MMKTMIFSATLLLTASAAMAEMTVTLGSPWDGEDVPDGQQCALFGGNGSTPPMEISDLPVGSVQINVEYNDKSYAPLARNGGHGIIGFPVSGETAILPSVPGLSSDLADGIFVVKAARSSGDYASDGYLPPCSGGRGNRYSATIKALSEAGEELEQVVIAIGRY
ncbi:MAG: hypothetical protein GY945_04995 [Rhodobacteraceae bacterium]|nr:hypothetical protein [Paracoccaceae bacterium]